MEGPCPHCTTSGEYEVLQKLDPQAEFCRCPFCQRTYLLAELSLDAMCIESIEQLIWKEMDDPPSGDALGYVLENKPYYASSHGGSYHRIDARTQG
ncbi:MAG: hypothetical protein RH862_05485 [Leptospiraceae bacterium]